VLVPKGPQQSEESKTSAMLSVMEKDEPTYEEREMDRKKEKRQERSHKRKVRGDEVIMGLGRSYGVLTPFGSKDDLDAYKPYSP
jgi:hypothetical protein